jgi:hypothetical protein
VLMTPDEHKAIADLAKLNSRSISDEVLRRLRATLDRPGDWEDAIELKRGNMHVAKRLLLTGHMTRYLCLPRTGLPPYELEELAALYVDAFAGPQVAHSARGYWPGQPPGLIMPMIDNYPQPPRSLTANNYLPPPDFIADKKFLAMLAMLFDIFGISEHQRPLLKQAILRGLKERAPKKPKEWRGREATAENAADESDAKPKHKTAGDFISDEEAAQPPEDVVGDSKVEAMLREVFDKFGTSELERPLLRQAFLRMYKGRVPKKGAGEAQSHPRTGRRSRTGNCRFA